MSKITAVKAAEDVRERMAALQEQIADGEAAEAVLDFAGRLKKEIEEDTLKALLMDDDVEEIKTYYRVACRFVDMLEYAANNGRRKKDTMAAIIGRRK